MFRAGAPLGHAGSAARSFEMMHVQLDRRLVRLVQNARRSDADGHHNRVADFLFGAADLQRLLDVPLRTPLALRNKRASNCDELFGIQVQRAVLEIALLVEAQIDLAQAWLDHAHGARWTLPLALHGPRHSGLSLLWNEGLGNSHRASITPR